MLYDYTGVELKKYPTLIGDGIADDSDALQHLVNTQREIRIPSGLTIRLTKTIVFDIDKIKLFDGGNSQFVMDGYDRVIFQISGSMTTGMSANPDTLNGLHDQIILSESGFILQNCKCKSTSATEGVGVKLIGCMHTTICNMYIANMKEGIVLSGVSRNLNICENHIFMLSEAGIHIKDDANTHQVNICNNVIMNAKYCVYVENPENAANLEIVGNDIEIFTYPNVDYLMQRSLLITSDDVKTGLIAELVFSGNTIQGHSYSDCIIEIYGGAKRKVREMTISNNAVSNMKVSNIILRKCMITAISGNAFSSDQRPDVQDNYCISLESCEDMAITGNAYAAVGHFLQADADCENITVVGNCGACKYDAIEIAEGATVETYANSSRYQDKRPW